MYYYSVKARHDTDPSKQIEVGLGSFGSPDITLDDMMNEPEAKEILDEVIPPDYSVSWVSWELDKGYIGVMEACRSRGWIG